MTERWDELMADPTTPLPKIDSMMKEVLRLYPIAPFISRQTTVPVNLGSIQLDQQVRNTCFWSITFSLRLNFLKFYSLVILIKEAKYIFHEIYSDKTFDR